MSRLTINLDDALHQALKETAARQGRTIGKIIEEGLILRGIKPLDSARKLVEQARLNAAMNDAEALELATSETRDERQR
jgi:predicted transcriptional regulator